MDEYLYIIIGVIAVAFNIYRKAQKAKAKNQVNQPIPKQEKRKPFVPKNFPQDLIDELDNAFGNKPDENYNITEKIEVEKPIIKTEKTEKAEKIENTEKDIPTKISIEKIKAPKKKFNMKEAIIYNAILERKY